MFALSPDDLEKRILACGDGPASFNATGNANGGDIVSVDPQYAFSKVKRIFRRTRPIGARFFRYGIFPV